jgi:catechol 2,3-dioxygenase-like lactoylglutathione lyase family enzyme
MIGGVFLLSRDPERLAEWYKRHLGWELAFLPEEGYYTERYFREDANPEQRQHLVFAIMPGDPGSGEGHIINYRVNDLDAVVASLQQDGVEVSAVQVGPDAEGEGKFARLRDPDGHRIELWEHL